MIDDWLVAELLVEAEGLDTAEERIKSEFDEHSNERYELLGHARKFADRAQEAEA